MVPEPIEILLVDDDPEDIDLTRETLKEGKLMLDIHTVGDGEQAMAYLRKQGEFADAPRPDLVLLDLNMPKMSGAEVIAAVKSDDDLKTIPIIVLTTSEDDADVQKVYELGANCYVNKPIGLEQFTVIVKALENFWFSVVKLPHGK